MGREVAGRVLSPAEETELVRRAAGDDLAAFAVLVRTHEAGLRRYLRRLAGDEADDLAQETLLTAWRALRHWRAEGSLAGWLRAIATRKFLDRRRKVQGREAAWQPTENPLPGCESAPDNRLMIDQALASLPPGERAAALLVFAEGHSHGEAATAMGLPLGTLKSMVARARAKLIPLLEGVAP